MATKSKNTEQTPKQVKKRIKSEKKAALKVARSTERRNLFAGFVSWACMLLLIFGVLSGLCALFFVSFFPGDKTASLVFGYMEGYYAGNMSHEERYRMICLFGLVFLGVLVVFLFRKDRKAFEATLARGFSKIWVELKFLTILLIIFGLFYINRFWISFVVVVFLSYLLCMDVGYNRTFFKRNMVNSLLQAFNHEQNKSTYEHLVKKRMVTTVIVIVGIVLLALLVASLVFYYQTVFGGREVPLLLSYGGILISGVFGVGGAFLWFYLTQAKDLRELNEIMGQVEEMYNGNLNAVNHIPPTSHFYDFAMQLNMIRTGIEKAVEEGVRADMTKVELITNVSHDVKTPLTSIVSYVELLKKEPDLPPHVQDYVNTIAMKTERLSMIVQDVFEVSKAATGNIQLNMAALDIGKLLQQTLAEMDESIQESPLNWRTDIPPNSLMIYADGQKLYRVFQNLIRNVIQYSLPDSRVYMMLRENGQRVDFTIRNIAKAELAPSEAEYLTGRFVRGDRARATEGSGLGLSIAKSFTEACGGSFELKTDGDIFLVKVSFPLMRELQELPQPQHPPMPVG